MHKWANQSMSFSKLIYFCSLASQQMCICVVECRVQWPLVILQEQSRLFCETEPLTGIWGLLINLACLPSKDQGSVCPSFPSYVVISLYYQHHAFTKGPHMWLSSVCTSNILPNELYFRPLEITQLVKSWWKVVKSWSLPNSSKQTH